MERKTKGRGKEGKDKVLKRRRRECRNDGELRKKKRKIKKGGRGRKLRRGIIRKRGGRRNDKTDNMENKKKKYRRVNGKLKLKVH